MSRTEGREANLAPHPGAGSWGQAFCSPGIEKVKGVLCGWEIEELENPSLNLLEARTTGVTGNDLMWF